MQGPPAYDDQQPHGQPAAYQEMRGQERPYGLVLLFYIITLGIYGLFWHYKTHDELCQQVGRENKDKTLWFVYIGVYAVIIVLAIVMLAMFVSMVVQAGETEPSEEMLFSFLASILGLVMIAIVGWLVQLVLFVIYVLRQFTLLDEVHKRVAEPMRLSGGGFMGLYFGAIAVNLIPFVGAIGAIAMQIIAYYLFQENYNGVWRTIKQGRHVPTDAEWAAGGARPPMPGSGAWDAPGQAGYPAAATPMAAGAGATATSQPGPSGPTGYSVRDQRSPGTPIGRLVHQSFECPRCQSHIAASGAPAARVDIRCTNCGEGGTVTMPNA